MHPFFGETGATRGGRGFNCMISGWIVCQLQPPLLRCISSKAMRQASGSVVLLEDLRFGGVRWDHRCPFWENRWPHQVNQGPLLSTKSTKKDTHGWDLYALILYAACSCELHADAVRCLFARCLRLRRAHIRRPLGHWSDWGPSVWLATREKPC